jgi:CRP/FNR family transcriptional regulator, cyclic AMP receptor protein
MSTLGEKLRGLVPEARVLSLSKHDTVYSCADRDTSVYLVERGQVKSVAPSVHGKDCLLDIYTPGDVFGESGLLGGHRTETVTAMTSTTLRRLPDRWLLDALADAGLRESFVRYLVQRGREQQRLITYLITADSESRLAVVLLHLAAKLGRRRHQFLYIEQRITQQELSGMVGTTRSRVGYFLKRFRDAGLVAPADGPGLAVDEVRLNDFVMTGTIPRIGR